MDRHPCYREGLRMIRTTITDRFAEFVTSTRSGAVPRNVIEAATRALDDTLAVGLGGRDEHTSEIAASWLADSEQSEQATLWGRGKRATVAGAAFLNAIQSHVLDYD